MNGAPATRVAVVGGGWAGLAAGVELARGGANVVLVEASRQLGGRARALAFGRERVDNGQHILVGACSTVLELLSTLGLAEDQLFRRLPLTLALRDLENGSFLLAAPRLPAPLHLLWALSTARGLSGSEKMAALRLMLRLRRKRLAPDPDIPLAALLARHRQPPRVTRRLWEPLCLATLNTPIETASSILFLNVLGAAFFGGRRTSDLLLPVADLGRCFPEPARDYIERHGGSVRLGVRAQGIAVSEGAVAAVALERETLPVDHVVLAVPPRAARDLLPDDAGLDPARHALQQLGAAPICTAYLRYPPAVRLERDFVGLLGTATQWLFDRGRLTGEPGLMAAVISGPGSHMRLDAGRLTAQIVSEIAAHFPDWPPPLATKLVREKQATFAAAAGVSALRPAAATAIRGLWLAGDYTETGFPSTLEGAAASGVKCARLILNPPS